jgi:aspartate racemase
MKLIYPDEAFQELVTLGICNSKNKIRFEDKNSVKEHPYNCFDMVCNHLIVDKGVDCIVAGCTDIRNVYRPQIENIGYVDSLEVLANEIIKKSL